MVLSTSFLGACSGMHSHALTLQLTRSFAPHATCNVRSRTVPGCRPGRGKQSNASVADCVDDSIPTQLVHALLHILLLGMISRSPMPARKRSSGSC